VGRSRGADQTERTVEMGTSRCRTWLLGGLAAAIAAPLTLGWMAVPAHAASQAPPGNNGTIKVDGMPFDDGHDEDSHVGCQFRIELFGYDAGTNTADDVFDAHPPTDDQTLLTDHFAFTDNRDHGGATFDTAKTYDLSAAIAGLGARKQGFHVALSVSVDGQNAKHKVFWIQGCGQSSATSANSANSAGAANGAGAGTQAARRAELARRAQLSTRTAAAQAGTTSAAAPQAGTTSAAAPAGAAVLGATASRATAPPASSPANAAVLGEQLSRAAPAKARTGALALTGFAALLWTVVAL